MKSYLVNFVVFMLFSAVWGSNGYLKINANYYLSQYQTDFVMAAINCKVNGWTLVNILNQEDNNALNDTVNALELQDTPLWIGGVRSGNSIYWLDTGDHADYTNWAPAEPSCTATSSCCVLFNQKGGGFWYLNTCSSQQYYVCKKN